MSRAHTHNPNNEMTCQFGFRPRCLKRARCPMDSREGEQAACRRRTPWYADSDSKWLNTSAGSIGFGDRRAAVEMDWETTDHNYQQADARWPAFPSQRRPATCFVDARRVDPAQITIVSQITTVSTWIAPS